jgi:hypothetical protein
VYEREREIENQNPGQQEEAASRLVEGGRHVHVGVGRVEAMFRRTEHEGFVEDADASQLNLEFLYPGSERAVLLVKIGDADGGTLEDRSLGRLLVGGRKGRLETVVPFPEFVTTTLLRLDALFANVLTTAFWLAVCGTLGREIIVFFEVTEVIFFLGLPCRSSPGWTRGAGGASITAVAMN